MGVFRVFVGRRGVVGFNGCCLGASSGDDGFTPACISGRRGVIGFNVAAWLCPVREQVRPAWPDVGASAKEFAQRTKNGRKSAFYGALGEFFRGRAAGGAVLGEVFRGSAGGGSVLGELFRGYGVEGLVLGGMCSVLPQCVSVGSTRDRFRGCLREGSKAGEGAVAHANLRGPLEAPRPHTATHSHTQRMQERPGPWPRALPTTHELRKLPEQLQGVGPDHEWCQDHRRAETHAKAADHVGHPVDAQVQARHANKDDERQRRSPQQVA